MTKHAPRHLCPVCKWRSITGERCQQCTQLATVPYADAIEGEWAALRCAKAFLILSGCVA